MHYNCSEWWYTRCKNQPYTTYQCTFSYYAEDCHIFHSECDAYCYVNDLVNWKYLNWSNTTTKFSHVCTKDGTCPSTNSKINVSVNSSECTHFDNNSYLTQPGQILLDLIIINDDTIKLEFDIKLNDYCNVSLCNIVSISSDDFIDVLSLSINGITNYIEIKTYNVDDYIYQYGISKAYKLLPVDQQIHHVYLSLNATDFVFKIDGVLQFQSAAAIQFTLPTVWTHVYFSGSKEYSVNATVSNICVKSLVIDKIVCGDTLHKKTPLSEWEETMKYYYYLQINNNSFFNIDMYADSGSFYLYSYDTNEIQLIRYNKERILMAQNVTDGKYILLIKRSKDFTLSITCSESKIQNSPSCDDKLSVSITKGFTLYYLNITQKNILMLIDSCSSYISGVKLNLYLWTTDFVLLQYGTVGACNMPQLFIKYLNVGIYILQVIIDANLLFGIWYMDILCNNHAFSVTNLSINIGTTDSWVHCGQDLFYNYHMAGFSLDTNESLIEVNFTHNIKYLLLSLYGTYDYAVFMPHYYLYDSKQQLIHWFNDTNTTLYFTGRQKIALNILQDGEYTLQMIKFVNDDAAWSLHVVCCEESYYDSNYIFYSEFYEYVYQPIYWKDTSLICEKHFGTNLASIITQDDWHCVLQIIGDNIMFPHNLHVYIGLHRDAISANKWYWMDGHACEITSDQIGAVSENSQNAMAGYLRYFQRNNMVGMSLNAMESTTSFELTNSGVSHHVLCSAPESKYQPVECTKSKGCWFELNCCNDSQLVDDALIDTSRFVPWIGYWNENLFIAGFNEIHYTTFNIFSSNYHWNHISYNDIRLSYLEYWQIPIMQPKYAQYRSLLYIYIIYEEDMLFKIDLDNPNKTYFYQPPNFLEFENLNEDSVNEFDFCMVANENTIYVISITAVFMYNLNEKKWIVKKFSSVTDTSNVPIKCVMDKYYRMIYVFPGVSLIMRYDTNDDSITFWDSFQFGEYHVGAVTAGLNGKLYIQGSYSIPWKTVVFDLKLSKLELETVDIERPIHKHIPYYRQSQLTSYDDNILLLMQFTDGRYPDEFVDTSWDHNSLFFDPNKHNMSIRLYYTITELISINFTQSLSSNSVWPSDGFTIKYYLNDLVNISNGTYHIQFCLQNDIANKINISMILDTSKDHCACKDYNCAECYQHLNLSDHIFPIHINSNSLRFVVKHGYNFDVLFLPEHIDIKLERCNISVQLQNSTTTNINPLIPFHFLLSQNCFVRLGEIFVVNITTLSLNISKQLRISVDDKGIKSSEICDIKNENDCFDCDDEADTFNIEYSLNDIHIGDHIVWLKSNMIDINLLSDHQIITYSSSQNTIRLNNTLLYLLFLLIVPIMIIVIICIYCKKQYKKAFVIDRALVLIIGIAQFDEKKYLLDGVKSNVKDLKKLWQNEYKYDVFVSNEEELYNTKNHIREFIDEHKIKLAGNVYQCLILHIISHGTDQGDCFLSSDQQNVNVEDLRRELTEGSMDAKRKTPLLKIIFNHACRGNNIYTTGTMRGVISICGTADVGDNTDPKKWEDSNWAIIWGNIKDRTISDCGNFTKCICDVFENNATKMIKKNFRELITQIGIDLEHRTGSGEICNMNETLREKMIRFERFSKPIKKGNDFESSQIELQQIYTTNTKDEYKELTQMNTNILEECGDINLDDEKLDENDEIFGSTLEEQELIQNQQKN
eukprot:350305_1